MNRSKRTQASIETEPEKSLFLDISHYSPFTWGNPACFSFIQLARNSSFNTEQRATLIRIDLYFKGNRPKLQKLCRTPINLLSLNAEVTVLAMGKTSVHI
jgi:hypothetical protein